MAETGCIGRDAELTRLQTAAEALTNGHGAVALISGESGVGKSTLLDAFDRALERSLPQAITTWGYCEAATGADTPLGPWRQVLNALTGVTASATNPLTGEGAELEQSVFESSRSALIELAPDLVELLVPGVGLVIRSADILRRRTAIGRRLAGSVGLAAAEPSSVAADRHQLLARYVSVIERVAEERQLVVVLEDLHWADQPSMELLHRLVARTRDLPLLVIGSYRQAELLAREPEVVETLTDIRIKAGDLVFDLDAARDTTGRDFVAAYVDSNLPAMGEDFIDELYQHTRGHAFFVAELVAHLRTRGNVASEDGSWRVVKAIDWSDLPAGVEGVVERQLAALDDDAREVLRAASVEGEQFTVEAVAQTLERRPRDVVRMLSSTLQRRHSLVTAVGTGTLGAQRIATYRFNHALVRNFVYASIDPVERAYLHEAVGEALEALAGVGTDEIAGPLAMHFDAAERHDKSARYFEAAGEQASAVFAFNEAASHFAAALERVPPADASARLRLGRALGGILNSIGRFADAETALRKAVALARQEDRDELPATLVAYADPLQQMHRFDEADAAVTEAAQLTDDPLTLARTKFVLAMSQRKRGDFGASLEGVQTGLETLETVLAQSDPEIARAYTALSWVLKELGRNAEAHAALERSLALHERNANANWSAVALTHNALADLCLNEENLDLARHHFEVAIEYWNKFEQHSDVSIGYNNLANAANRQGQFAEALSFAQRSYALDLETRGPSHPDMAFPLTCIGESHLGLGDFDAAVQALEEAEVIRLTNNVPIGNLAWTRWLLARTLWESGLDRSRARDLLLDVRNSYDTLGQAVASERAELEAWLQEQGVSLS